MIQPSHPHSRENAINVLHLPAEILQQIFHHLYSAWHLQYTQDHDGHKVAYEASIMPGCSLGRYLDVPGVPLFSRLPSIAALLTCKTFYEVGYPAFSRSFTGYTHVASRCVWQKIHHTYEGVMARTKDLVIDYKYIWSFTQLWLINKMPNLERMRILLHGLLQGYRWSFFRIERSAATGTKQVCRSNLLCKASPEALAELGHGATEGLRLTFLNPDRVELMARRAATKDVLACRVADAFARERDISVIWSLPFQADVVTEERWPRFRFYLIVDFMIDGFDTTETLADAAIVQQRLYLRSDIAESTS